MAAVMTGDFMNGTITGRAEVGTKDIMAVHLRADGPLMMIAGVVAGEVVMTTVIVIIMVAGVGTKRLRTNGV